MNKIPAHMAIIMDGNGRWAAERGLTRSRGHLEGSKNFKKLALHIFEKKVKILSVFAFSTENFNREPKEVEYLMTLFVKVMKKEFEIFDAHKIKVIFSGRREKLKKSVLKTLDAIAEQTKHNTQGILNICLNYGGREEIIDAVKKICDQPSDLNNLTSDNFSKYLYQDLPPIDLLIRTSGEYRISNFMLYQLAYAEMFFSDTYFPAFTTNEIDQILLAYSNRDRRFGVNHKA